MEAKTASLIEHYSHIDAYDEMFKEDMTLRDTWKKVYHNFETLGHNEIISRQKDIDWNLSENGTTYNIYNDPNGQNRPWNLNIFPFVMHKKEWDDVEKGLQQRVHLLDLVVKDIYGERQLLKKGIIPQEVIFGHRGFLRQCDGIESSTKQHLSVYAADLSRGPDGRMWMVNDRVQAPSGMGYALENRTITSNVLPNLYKDLSVVDQYDFFNTFNQLLIDAAPNKILNPNIVVLTPGPSSESYFEHSYLANYYGYPLVRGNDLLVRDGKLWMKSLKGLKQVNVVYRRVEDMFIDPLELREDSYLGVAGLLDVVRRKNVSILNPVGVGVIENPGLIPFMPAIAKYFLDEELILPQIATWWCGQKKELDHVMANISKLVIKRIDRSSRETIVFGELLDATELEALKQKIKSRPHLYVAQERIKFSTVPNFTDGKLEPRNMICRAFAIADKAAYKIMPGGLVRVSSTSKTFKVNEQRGGTSKDFCVIDENYVKTVKPKYCKITTTGLTKLNDLPSLTAENLYWAGRYASRALVVSRHLRMVLKEVSKTDLSSTFQKHSKIDYLLNTVTELTNVSPGFSTSKNVDSPDAIKKELIAIVVDKNKAGSLASSLSLFSNSFYAIRNLASTDMWRVLDSMQKLWHPITEEDQTKLSYKRLIKILDQLITKLIAFMGLIEESILVEQGLLLYFIGLNLERAMLNTTIFQNMLIGVEEDHVQYEILEALLHSHESLNIYRYSYRSHINIESVLSLIMLNTKYARSLTFLVGRLKKDIGYLPHSKTTSDLQDYEKGIFEAYSKLRLSNTEYLSEISGTDLPIRAHLKTFLDMLQVLFLETSKSISDTYFNHSKGHTQLTSQKFS